MTLESLLPPAEPSSTAAQALRLSRPAAHDASKQAATADPDTASQWVPIRSLSTRHRDRIVAHLSALDQRSRYLRFGYFATDAHIDRYVAGLDFERDEVFGVFNRRLELIAMAHLAYRPADADGQSKGAAEFGVSVLPKARRRGFGSRLFEHAVLHARNRGMRDIFIHALSENAAMLKIARRAGAVVEREGSESEAWLSLRPDSVASHLDQIFGRHAAEVDYGLKHHHFRSDFPASKPAAP